MIMKEYIVTNLEPILLGVVIGIVFMVLKECAESIISKIAILMNE